MYTAQMTKERVKSLCKNKKINMEQMLIECSLGVNAIRQINDTKGMASFSLAKIADYLDCSVDYLLGRSDNPNISTESYIGGDNNGVQAIKNGTVTIRQSAERNHNCNEIEAILEKLSRADQLRAIADMIELLEEKYGKGRGYSNENN